MPKVDRVVKRNIERAKKATTRREKLVAGAAFEQGIRFGMALYKTKLEKAVENLTYE